MVQVWALILAGGASARFWPYDGDHQPKYLLQPGGGESLLRRAWGRACLMTGDPARVAVLTGAAQADLVRQELPELGPERLLVEPARRDTLPAVALGMAALKSWADGDPVTCVLPADSYLEPANAPALALARALAADLPDQSRLFSFTVPPTRAETGFGYLELAEPLAGGAVAVARFREKPDHATAAAMVEDGRHHWNVGSFAWRASAFWRELARQQPAIAAAAETTWREMLAGEQVKAAEAFKRAPAVSIDYGLMEGAESVGALPIVCEFDDVGTWDALAALGGLSEPDVAVDSSGCAVRADDRVAFVGCRDLLLIQEAGRILVMARGSGQRVREARQLAEGERRDPPVRPGADSSRPGVMLGVDFGTVRTGVAACDDMGLLASPVSVVQATEMAETVRQVIAIAKERGAVGAVIGMPYNMDGTEGPAAERVRRFGELLQAGGMARIEYQDERLTSWEADAQLRDAGRFGKHRKQRLDSASATLILEAWLKARRGEAAGPAAPVEDGPWEKSGWQKGRKRR